MSAIAATEKPSFEPQERLHYRGPGTIYLETGDDVVFIADSEPDGMVVVARADAVYIQAEVPIGDLVRI